VTNGIEGAAMQLLWAAKGHQVQVGTSAKEQLWGEVQEAGLVVNPEEYDEAINSLLEAGAVERMLGKGLA
jgi:hypothetical protein